MKAILILIFYTTNTAAIHHIELPSAEACVNALQQIKEDKKYPVDNALHAYCVPA